MKKYLALFTAVVLSLSLAACAGDPDNNSGDVIDSTNYKVGIGSYTSTTDSASSVEGENGKGVVSTTYATVVFDDNNIIKQVYIDEVESKVYFDSTGKLLTDKNSNEIKSKRELGDAYNMKPASGIGKEWYEQINTLEQYLIGKNIDDIANYVTNMGPYGTQNDYASSLGQDVENGVGDVVDGIVDGAESIAGDVADGITGKGMNYNDNGMGKTNSNNMRGTPNNNTRGTTSNSTNSNSGDSVSSDIESNDNMSGDSSPSNAASPSPQYNINWEEDLKSGVTIDMTNIQRALQKAYANAQK